MIHITQPDVIQNALSQQRIILDIVSPLLRKRYKEKFDALHIPDDWLLDANVSVPIEYHGLSETNKHFNTKLNIGFKRNHPIFKGSFSLLYQRATFEEAFDIAEDHVIRVAYEDLISVPYKEKLNFWLSKITEELGDYFGIYGTCVYHQTFDRRMKLQDKHVVFEVPSMIRIRELFDFDFLKRNSYVFDLNMIIDNSYLLLPTRKTIKLEVYRLEPIDDTTPNEDYYETLGNKIKHHAHTWIGN